MRSEFENQKHALVVVEVSVKSENIGVAKMALNLNFPSQLMLNLSFDQLLFV